MRKISDGEMKAKGYNLDLKSDRQRCALGLPPLTMPDFLTRSESLEWERKGKPPQSVIDRCFQIQPNGPERQ